MSAQHWIQSAAESRGEWKRRCSIEEQLNCPFIRINWKYGPKSTSESPVCITLRLYCAERDSWRRKEKLVKAEEVFQSIFTAKSTYKRRVKESTGVLEKQKNKCPVSVLGKKPINGVFFHLFPGLKEEWEWVLLRVSNWTLGLPTSCLTFHKEFLLILCKSTSYIWLRWWYLMERSTLILKKEKNSKRERKKIRYVLFQLLKCWPIEYLSTNMSSSQIMTVIRLITLAWLL